MSVVSRNCGNCSVYEWNHGPGAPAQIPILYSCSIQAALATTATNQPKTMARMSSCQYLSLCTEGTRGYNQSHAVTRIIDSGSNVGLAKGLQFSQLRRCNLVSCRVSSMCSVSGLQVGPSERSHRSPGMPCLHKLVHIQVLIASGALAGNHTSSRNLFACVCLFVCLLARPRGCCSLPS